MARRKAAVTTATIEAQRTLPVEVTWPGGMASKHAIGRIRIDGVLWANVEWSNKRECWCIEDCEGRCLMHEENLRGQEASAEAAVASATRMIRDGTMPAPSVQAFERARRSRQPAVIRRRAERAAEEDEYRRVSDAYWKARIEEQTTVPLYETIAECFDFSDPDLWKSNSFSSLRPALIAHVQRAIANLEYEVHWEARNLRRERAAIRTAILAKRQGKPTKNERRLARAREILALLEGEPQVQSEAAE